MWTNIRLKESRQFDWGVGRLVYPCHSYWSFFNSVNMSSVYNLRVWCSSHALPWETWQIPGKQNFPSSPALLCLLFSAAAGVLRTALCSQNPPAWPEMKWWELLQFKLIHTSHLWHDWFSFSMLKYEIVSFLFPVWKQLMYTALACHRRGSGWHVEEQLKWIRMKFESAIFHLSITFQRDLLTTNRETLGEGVPICGALWDRPFGLINQDISCWSKFCTGTLYQLRVLRDVWLRPSRYYW